MRKFSNNTPIWSSQPRCNYALHTLILDTGQTSFSRSLQCHHRQSLSEMSFRQSFSLEKLHLIPVCRTLFRLNGFLLASKPTLCITEKITQIKLLWGVREAFRAKAEWLSQVLVLWVRVM